MIVIDASVLSNAIADDDADGHRARGELRTADGLAAPDLVDVETIAVLRKRWLAGGITDQRFAVAVEDLEDLETRSLPDVAADAARIRPASKRNRLRRCVRRACRGARMRALDRRSPALQSDRGTMPNPTAHLSTSDARPLTHHRAATTAIQGIKPPDGITGPSLTSAESPTRSPGARSR